VCNPNGKALACFPSEKYELGYRANSEKEMQ
jgi:hypothetical protein